MNVAMWRNEIDIKIVVVSVITTIMTVLFIYFAFAEGIPGAETAAENSAIGGIAFPIPELGNCADKDSCKSYCNDATHIESCISFAESHGLMNKEDVGRAKKFAGLLRAGGGPGGCSSPESCEAFCSNLDNIESCVAFAKGQGIHDKNIEQGEKILRHIKSGGATPGGCRSKESCEKYCADFSHAEECFMFAKKVGIEQEGAPSLKNREFGRDEGIPDEEHFQKFIELVKSGATPGGCKTKDECETYCEGQGHFEECVAFGEKVGFIRSDQADAIRKTGGNGPGGCSSPQACRNYCDDPAHQEDCFKFAEEHGLIPPEELKQAKEGFVRLRAGLEQAPPEVAECLKTTLGPNVIQDIQSGGLTPGPQIGERVRNCFDRFGRKHDPQEIFRNAPPQVLACLKEKLGDRFGQIRSGQAELTPELGDTFRVCFEQMRFSEGGHGSGGGPPPQAIQGFLRTAPPGVAACLKEKLGGEYEKIASGESPLSPEIGQTIRGCFEQFRPDMDMRLEGRGGFPPGGAPGPGPEGLRGFLENAPPNVAECLKESVGDEVFSRIQSGERPAGEIGEKIKACFRQNPPGEMFMPPFGGPAGDALPPSTLGGSRFPETVNLCLKQKLSEEQIRAFQSGSRPSPDVEISIRECFSQLQSPSGTLPSLKPIFEHPTEQFAPPPTAYPDPATKCANYGGTWTGSTCEFRSAPQLVPPPPTSYTPPPTYLDPATECANHGGTWTGSTCQFPTQPPPGASLFDVLIRPLTGLLR